MTPPKKPKLKALSNRKELKSKRPSKRPKRPGRPPGTISGAQKPTLISIAYVAQAPYEEVQADRRAGLFDGSLSSIYRYINYKRYGLTQEKLDSLIMKVKQLGEI